MQIYRGNLATEKLNIIHNFKKKTYLHYQIPYYNLISTYEAGNLFHEKNNENLQRSELSK